MGDKMDVPGGPPARVYGPSASGWAFVYYPDFIHVWGDFYCSGSFPIWDSQAGP